MRTLERPLPLWSKQAEFLDAPATVKGFVGGIGSGKSKIGAYDLLRRVRDGRLYMVTAPTYKVLRDATCRSFEETARYCGTLLRPVGGEGFSAHIRPFAGGKAEVLFRSTENPDLLRGPNLSGVWMDEASLSPYEAYQNLIGRLREGGELGWLTLTFTPKGRLHWTYSEVFGKDPPRSDVHLVKAATRDNPFLHEAFLETVEANFAGLLAAQELGGDFVQVEGAEWPSEWFHDGIWFADWPERLTVRTIGIDPSKGKDAKAGDYSAIVLYGRGEDGLEYVEADVRRINPKQICEATAEAVALHRPDGVLLEANAWQDLLAPMMREAMKARRVEVPSIALADNMVPKPVRIRRLTAPLGQGKMRFRRGSPGTRLLVEQLMAFPEGAHDDGPDALEMSRRLAIELVNGRQARPRR